MAKYSDIKGFTVQTLASDTIASQVLGGTWASGGTMNTARSGTDGGTGTQTAAMLGGGASGPGANAEQYNGSSWTEVADLNTPRGYIGGAGTTTAMVTFGGNSSPKAYTELWNGSAWTESGDLNTGRQSMGACGATSTAALCISGADPSRVTNVESWNGSAWTEIADVNQERYYTTGSGSQTDALLIAGQDPPVKANVEKWDGSSWTEVGDLNLARFALASSSNPSGSDDTLAFGGHTASPDADKTNTESWNGTSWTEVADLSSAVAYHSGAGSDLSAALSFGGSSPSVTGASEEFTAPAVFSKQIEGQLFFNSTTNAFKETLQDIPAGTWATGGTLNAGHGYGTGFGLQTAAVCCFGGYPTHTNNTETYNGSAWTEVNEGNTARRNLGGFGILTSGLAFGGGPPFNPALALTEAWDGTSWTETGDFPAGYYNSRGIGTSSSSGLSIGGVSGGSKKADAWEWGGSSWSEITEMATTRESGSTSSAGSTTAGLVFGGESPSLTVNTELWNGSSWTELNNLNTARGSAGGNGTSTSALCYGGNIPSAPPYQSTINEFWNGTSWTELNDLGTGLGDGIAPAGGAVSGLASGGQSGPSTQNTVSQEWTASLGNKTITAS